MRETLHRIVARIQAHFGFSRIDPQVDTELELHLAMSIEDYIRRGMTEDEARRNARLDLGALQKLREEHRETRGLPFLDTLAQDLRYAFRTLRRDLGFTVCAILIASLGIGASTVIFSVVDAALLMPLPFTDPGRLVWICNLADDRGSEWRADV
jgi:hypothetical protein